MYTIHRATNLPRCQLVVNLGHVLVTHIHVSAKSGVRVYSGVPHFHQYEPSDVSGD